MNDAEKGTRSTPDRASNITRGVMRHFTELDHSCLVEFPLGTGRRVDVIALDGKGKITIVEVKSSPADFRSDRKWHEYLPFCDRFYFAVDADFPVEMLPADCGLIVADAYGAAVVQTAIEGDLNPSRRRALTLRYARTAARRLNPFADPNWLR
jgi:hypothetical protein